MKIFLVILGSVLLFVFFIKYLERTSVFYPARQIQSTPKEHGLNFEDIFFKTEDELWLNGWFVKASAGRPTVLFFHGNAGNIGDRIGKILKFNRINLNVFIVDYRGYGKSAGRPTEDGMYKDAEAAYQYLLGREDVDPERIIIYGESLGGVAASDLASRNKVAGLILDATFTSAADMSQVIYPFVPTFLLSLKMDSAAKIASVRIPKLFIHSPDDEVVPYRLGRKLYDRAPEPKEFLQISGSHNGDHSDTPSVFWRGIIAFLSKNNLIY